MMACWLIIVALWTRYRPANGFGWDAFAYHLYLPSVVQHGQLKLDDISWVEDARVRYDASSTLYFLNELPDGTHLVKVTYGAAALWSPWYLIGHAVAVITGADTDGYSAPYQTAVQLGMLVYVFIGLYWLRAALVMRVSDRIAALTMVVVVFGTNYPDQAVSSLTMPHALLFSLYAGVLLFTQRWQAEPDARNSIAVAACMGFAAVVRPSELVCLIIPIFWSVANGSGVRGFFHFHWLRRKQWALIAVVLFLIALPQFLYWYHSTGHFLFDSYGKSGEGFDLLMPHTADFLFSFRKGWYLYTPIMFIATLGLAHMCRKQAVGSWAIAIFFLLNLWVVSSWSTWWYADSFSSRAMVQSYPVMALPLALILQASTSWRRLPRAALHTIAVLCFALNVFQYMQFKRGLIHPSRMTKSAYKAVFLRMEAPPDFEERLMVARAYDGTVQEPDSNRYARVILNASFAQQPPTARDTLVPLKHTNAPLRMYRMDRDHIYSPAVRIPFNTLTRADHAFITTYWYLRTSGEYPPLNGRMVVTFEHNGVSYAYNAFDVRTPALVPDSTVMLSARILSPELRDPRDPLVLYFWSQDTVPFLVSDPKLELHEPLPRP